ncbi:MAG: HDIG domain-containing protein [Bacteroidia bacterium]
MSSSGGKRLGAAAQVAQVTGLKWAERLPRSSRARWFMIGFFILITAIILPKDFVPEFNYELGKPWVAPALKADFDFAIYKPASQFEEERRQAKANVPPVFRMDSSVAQTTWINAASAIERCFGDLTSYITGGNAEEKAEMRQRIQSKYGVDPELSLAEYGDLRDWKVSFANKTDAFIKEVYVAGLTDTVKSAFNSDVIYVRRSETRLVQKALALSTSELPDFLSGSHPGIDPTERRLIRAMILPLMVPNLHYDPKATELEQDRAVERVSAVVNKVAKGETIISKGERVNETHDRKITSYLAARADRFGRTPYFITLSGQLVMVTIVTMLLVLFIRNNRPRLFFSPRKFALVLLVFLSMVVAFTLVLKLTVFTQEVAGINYIYLAPACMVTIILSAFFDSRFAFFGNLIVAVFAGAIIPNGFEYFFIQLSAGTTAVYSTTRLRNRGDFFISLSLIFLTYVASYIGYKFYTRGSFANIEYINLLLFGLNVMLTLITYPVIYLFERIFGITSDLTYIELLDTNHPLLKELSVRAPGTFQHSIQVANLAEAVLNKIGGNSLQAKVGALFHDVGKMLNPLFFIENLGDHQNPHDAVSYHESADIIIRHVADGVRLAQEHNLPAEVIDFIKTHHGTTRAEYFYRKHVAEHPGEEVDVYEFQYPGPLPFTREMAVLMIADSIEAAARALKDHSPDKLLALVESIVDSKVRQRQFDKANLTFRDLEESKQVIFSMLSSIYHGRIDYPAEANPAQGAAPAT